MMHTLITHTQGARPFECSVCGQTWTRKPTARCPGPTHDLVQHASDHYECRACFQVWTSPPEGRSENKCPQLKVYPRLDWGDLMSEVQLDYANYRTSKNALPAPVACYRNGSGTFVMLYDPTQAQKKSPSKHPRETLCLSEIVWPEPWALWLDASRGDKREDGSRAISQREVLTLIYHLLPFTPAEIEHYAGPCMRFRIRPVVVHRTQSLFFASRKELESLFVNIILSYRDFRAAL